MEYFKRKIAEFKKLRSSRKISVLILLILIVISQVTSVICVVVVTNIIQINTSVRIPYG
ncbi:MAG: hypothetical protein ACFE9S_03325 [Candidatus Hermodarchaeota archaeon]